ncbi:MULTISPECIES: hypothetical protein [Capnocytophaga]|uniref:hypothetical protein n=1 Tax=Capnocytophaga TaxID=1016 RepID=UPI00027C6A93|nr:MULTISPECIES: hypothetical protein [Capnocytophaga]EJU27885.1 hypothetical protein HMPREF1154_2629 [Capnocytophaga sp. CM59]
MKKLLLLLCMWIALPAVAQTSDSRIPVIDASYLKQGSSYGQLGLHFSCYDSEKFVLLAGLAGNFRSEDKKLIAIPEAQLSAWIRADESHGSFVDIPILMLRPQLNFSPYYFAPEAGIQILIFYVKAGYAFPWGKISENYPFETGKFRFSAGVSIPLKI